MTRTLQGARRNWLSQEKVRSTTHRHRPIPVHALKSAPSERERPLPNRFGERLAFLYDPHGKSFGRRTAGIARAVYGRVVVDQRIARLQRRDLAAVVIDGHRALEHVSHLDARMAMLPRSRAGRELRNAEDDLVVRIPRIGDAAQDRSLDAILL